MAKVCGRVRELMFVSGPLVCPQIDTDTFIQLPDVIEEMIMHQLAITSPKP